MYNELDDDFEMKEMLRKAAEIREGLERRLGPYPDDAELTRILSHEVGLRARLARRLRALADWVEA